MNIEVILFDWGGTLANIDRQLSAIRAGLARALDSIGQPLKPTLASTLVHAFQAAEAEAARDPEHREADLVAIIGRWMEEQRIQLDQGNFTRFCEILGQGWVGSLDLFPDVLESLEELRGRGYRMGVVSNVSVPPQYCRQELARLGLAPLMDFEILSSEVGYRKPSPVIYEAALGKAYPEGRPADLSTVLFVGDSPAYDVIAPARMGMKTALVKTGGDLWPAADYAEADPDLCIECVAALPHLLG